MKGLQGTEQGVPPCRSAVRRLEGATYQPLEPEPGSYLPGCGLAGPGRGCDCRAGPCEQSQQFGCLHPGNVPPFAPGS